jgi:hypothetical protein
MTNFGVERGRKLFQLLERAIGEIVDPEKALDTLIKDNASSDGHYLELKRIHAALMTYLETDPRLRYVALVGSFSSGKTATINNLLGVAGTDQARLEDINPLDDKLTLCAHESKKDSLLATLLKSHWDADKFFHGVETLSDVILVDTPGEGDPTIRTDIVHNFLPICDTIVYCFNATNPLNSNDLPILRELNEVLQHTDFFYIYTRADNVFKKAELEPLSHDNFDKSRAIQQRDIFVRRLNDALSHLPARDPELHFIGNSKAYPFGIDELRNRIMTPPGDHTSLALNKLTFFRARSIDSLDGILGMLRQLSATVRELVTKAEENHQEYNTKFEIRTEEIKDFWRSAQNALRETLARYKDLEIKRISHPVFATEIERKAVREAKAQNRVEQFSSRLPQTITREIGHLTKHGFEEWKRTVRERVQSASLECIGDAQTSLEMTKSLKTSLRVTDEKEAFFGETQKFARDISLDVSQNIVASIVQSCKDFKSDFDKASRHSVAGEVFALEKQLNERCTKQIRSAIELYASLIDVYVSAINTAGTMLLIEKAHLAKDIDFLQSEKISDAQRRETTDNLVSEIFGTSRVVLGEIELRCGVFPLELKKWMGECDALSKEASEFGADISQSRLDPELAVLAPIWDEAIQPLVARYESCQEEHRAKVLSLLTKRYEEAQAEFEANKKRVISAWKKRIRFWGMVGVVAIMFGAIGYYQLEASQSMWEVILLAAAGEALWVFLVWVFDRVKSDNTEWIAKSKRQMFQRSTPTVLDEMRGIDLSPPNDLAEIQDQCRVRLELGLTQLVLERSSQIRSNSEALIAEVESIRRSGQQTVEAYRKEWEMARQIIETLYQENDARVAGFKSVATTFKERTMDRTRQLFGDRGCELERYVHLLEDCTTAMREIQ